MHWQYYAIKHNDQQMATMLSFLSVGRRRYLHTFYTDIVNIIINIVNVCGLTSKTENVLEHCAYVIRMLQLSFQLTSVSTGPEFCQLGVFSGRL